MYLEPFFNRCCRSLLTEKSVSGNPAYDEKVGGPGAPEGLEAPFNQCVHHGLLKGCSQISY